MSYVVTLTGFVPVARYDSVPWSTAKIEEGPSSQGPWTLIDTQTLAPADTNPTVPQARNFTVDNATLSSGWYRVTFVDAANNTSVADPISASGGFLSLSEYKGIKGYDSSDNRDDAQIERLLPYVSKAISNFSERDFGSPLVTEDRVFEYDGSGYLDIDDAADINNVALTYPEIPSIPDYALDVTQWRAQPTRRDDSPVYDCLTLFGLPWHQYGSPEMGFTRNLDLYVAENRNRNLLQMVKVNGDWGWPVVPEDVKMAAVMTLQEWMRLKSDEELTSESIESFSRSWGASGMFQALAIPNRARDLLVRYHRTYA